MPGRISRSQWCVSDFKDLTWLQEQPPVLCLCQVLAAAGFSLTAVNERCHCSTGKPSVVACFTLQHFQLTCKMSGSRSRPTCFHPCLVISAKPIHRGQGEPSRWLQPGRGRLHRLQLLLWGRALTALGKGPGRGNFGGGSGFGLQDPSEGPWQVVTLPHPLGPSPTPAAGRGLM